MSQQTQHPQDQATQITSSQEEIMDGKTTDTFATTSNVNAQEEIMDRETTDTIAQTSTPTTHLPTTTAKEIENDDVGDESEIPEVEVITAFEKYRADIEAIPEDKLISRSLTPSRAMQRGVAIAESAEEDRDLFIKIFNQPPLNELDTLKERSLAVKGADLVEGGKTEEIVPPDFDRARELRNDHTVVLKAVFRKAPEMLEQLNNIPSGNGHDVLGNACLAIASIERKHWGKIKEKNMLSTSEAAEIGRLGLKILRWEQQRSSVQDRKYVLRALTYLDQAYSKVRLYARVIYEGRRDEWRERYPALFTFNVSTRGRRGDVDREKDTKGRSSAPDESKPAASPTEPVPTDE